MDDLKIPPIFAIVVGINEYMSLSHLDQAVDDAKAVSTFLRDELNVPETNITELYDKNATKEAILTAISSLPSKDTFRPGNAVLFFFSGWAGKAPLREANKTPTSIGMICPVDINVNTGTKGQVQTGISDSTLVGLFDQISRSHGNNITLLLDCDSDIFDWENPSSCTIVTPEDTSVTDTGATFTRSLINVLRAEKKARMIQFLTVQSFAMKVQVDISATSAIKCFGRSVDRFLLDRTSGGAYYAFVLGQREVGGEITLFAGTAHGIEPGTRLSFFHSNVEDKENAKLGDLVVRSVSTTRAIVRRPRNDNIPVIFYAVETEYPGKTLRVMVEGQPPSAGAFQLDNFPNIEITDSADDANITLKFENDGTVAFYWNGVTSDKPHRRRDYYIYTFDTSSPRAVRMLRCAARFTHHLSRSSPTRSSLAQALCVEFLRVKENKPSEENILKNNHATLELKNSETLGPYCLVIHNTTEYGLWPYVFTFDAAGLTVLSWYIPPLCAEEPPLKAGQKLQVGCGDEQGLLLELWNNHPAITYIRVFATKERTDFSWITQWWNSFTEDRVRELIDPDHPSDDPPETPIMSDTTVMADVSFEGDKDQPNRTKFGTPAADWVAVTVAVVLEPKSDQ